MTLVLLTFILTTAGYAVLLWFALRKVMSHLQNNPEAQAAVTKHVVGPLFSSNEPPVAEEDKP